MYWCASSSQDCHPDVMVAKWISVANHIQNIHTHDDNNFPNCLHPPLTDQEKKRKWLQPNDQATEKLCDILLSKSMLNDVRMLSTGQQTASLESFHAVINHFAPKLTCFSYRGMRNRMMLAALHYNENAGRPQAKTRAGDDRYVVAYPKYKDGLPTVKKVLVSCTYNYVKALKYEVVKIAMGNKQTEVSSPEPPTITSTIEKMDKGAAISEHRSRFE